MGYSHYFTYTPAHPAYADAWPHIIRDTQRIVCAATAAGIVITGPDGYGAPTIDPEIGIKLNGNARRGLHCESLIIAPPAPRAAAPVWFCKTERRPYDVVVAATLLRAHLLLPDVFQIGSDGAWEREWTNGVTRWQTAGRPQELTARGLIADLFHARPTRSPLRSLTVLLHDFR
jgi:hypothetical protein